MRLLLAGIAGAAAAAGGAVVLGDYPLSGSVPWFAALLIPLLVGVVMNAVAGSHRREMWMATGPLAALAMAWGVRIATGWGLDPVPDSCWAAGAIALVWPPAYGLLAAGRHRLGGSAVANSIPAPGLPHGQLGDVGEVGRTQIGDP
jgi:hypothetical protein